MASRLDRLLLLLDTGSTPSVRQTAAQQLASLAGVRVGHASAPARGAQAQPDDESKDVGGAPPAAKGAWHGVDGEWSEVITLAARLLPFLQSKSLDTRQAAATALGLVSQAVGIWDPSDTETAAHDGGAAVPSTLAALDILKVAREHAALLGSSGNEYQSLSKMSAAELEAAQKAALENLGLGATGKTDIGVDLAQELGGAPGASAEASVASSSAADSRTATPPTDPFEGLSARERNKLKRQRKAESKSASSAAEVAAPKKRVIESSAGTPSAVAIKSESNDEDNKVTIDPAEKARQRAGGAKEASERAAEEMRDLEPKAGEWPWSGYVDRLHGGLMSASWEVRHGSSLALRELLRLQGEAGGKVAGLSQTENASRHRQWSEALASSLLQVLALDRFGDYLSDQVVAPVRETAAQALANLLRSMCDDSSILVQQALGVMIDQDGAPPSRGLEHHAATNGSAAASTSASGSKQYIWQVRHSGLLGLKYWVVVRKHMLQSETAPHALRRTFDAALLGLRDRDDDIRIAAAASLLPIFEVVVTHLEADLRTLLSVIWDCLSDLSDDLSSSAAGVMDLLGNLLAYPIVLDILRHSDDTQLRDLVPRLFPFARHTISRVRLAVVETIRTFVDRIASPQDWLEPRVFSVLFNNLILEERVDIRAASLSAWQAAAKALASVRSLYIQANDVQRWFALLLTPIGTALDMGQLTAVASIRVRATGVDKAMIQQDMSLLSVPAVLSTRIAAAKALGVLMGHVDATHSKACFGPTLLSHLPGQQALATLLCTIVIQEGALVAHAEPIDARVPGAQQRLQALASQDSLPPFQESTAVLGRVHTDCLALHKVLTAKSKAAKESVTPVAALSAFNTTQAAQLAATASKVLDSLPAKSRTAAAPAIEEQRRRVLSACKYHDDGKARWDRQVAAAVAGAVVATVSVPPKITPVVRSLTTSLKEEDNEELQDRTAHSVADFIALCSRPNSPVRVNPTDKVVKNICAYLCQDEKRTALFASSKADTDTILTLKKRPARGAAEKGGPSSDEAAGDSVIFRGATAALRELGIVFGADLFDRVPRLWLSMTEALTVYGKNGDAALLQDDAQGQALLDSLTVLHSAASYVGPNLHDRLLPLLAPLSSAARSRFSVVRHSAALTYAALAASIPSPAFLHIVEHVLPSLGDPHSKANRQGVMELLSQLVTALDVAILPYLIFFLVPVLGRMSDADDSVRLLATNTFAAMIKLVPLEAGMPDPPGFPEALLARRSEERQFLTQLLDGSKVEEYTIPVDISVDLRKYQRDGVSWLAFLDKYQLHGILCDDMGLGKTLQSICILASKQHERATRFAETGAADSAPLPSLVVCPPTLTGHWQHEIKTYTKNLSTIVFAGNKSVREALVPKIARTNVVITSYDTARNDVETLRRYEWHYIILDEGHIIKNGRTKLAQAIKTLRSAHRLILSGTPIQNNVLELWSLFDFLMPGFLGSEKTFNDRFGKPIAASRNAKVSSKEQERGALALEALHKQVLPFVLRRLKEDVLDDLPPKIIQDYYCDLSPLQTRLYDDFSSSQAKKDAAGEVASDSSRQPQHVFQALQYLRKLVSHPSLVFRPELQGHAQLLTKLQLGPDALSDIHHAPKLLALRQILWDCGIGTGVEENKNADEEVSQHRVLIFCQLKQMIDIIERDLFQRHMPDVSYMRLDGSTEATKRHAVVQTFNGDPSIDVMLLTTQVGGLGLNLTSADTVIFVEHDWNPMKDLQAMDRAHRLGQKRVVNVYRLIMRGTLEEKIMGLQRFKLNVASTVVSQQNSDLASLGTDQVLDLFNVSNEDEDDSKKKKASDAPVSRKALLEGLEDMPDGEDFADLDLASFTSTL